jgi:ABC-type branched-subunit amino acid transport system substrate-binding protein
VKAYSRLGSGFAPRGRRSGTAVLAAGLLFALAACGSSSSGNTPAASTSSAPATTSSSSAPSTATSSAATGSPIKVMSFGQFQATNLSYPEGKSAIDAAAKAINAAGGINGHQLDVESCNDQGDPNVAAQCARKAVSDKDVAVLGSYSQNAGQVLPILQAANIPYVGATAQSVTDTTSTVSFPLEGLNQVVFGGVGYGATLVGCKKAGILIENYGTTTPLAIASITAGIQLGGGQIVKVENTGTNLPDYSPAISAIESAGGQCVATIMPPDQIAEVFQAMRQSANPKIQMINAQDTFSTALLKQLGSTANGMILSSSTYPPTTTTVPEVPKLVAAIKQYEPGADISQFSIQGWGAMLLLQDVLKGISGTPTAATVLAGFTSLSGASTNGLYPPYTTTSNGPIAGAPRIFLTKVLILKYENGTETPVSKGFVNVIKP